MKCRRGRRRSLSYYQKYPWARRPEARMQREDRARLRRIRERHVRPIQRELEGTRAELEKYEALLRAARARSEKYRRKLQEHLRPVRARLPKKCWCYGYALPGTRTFHVTKSSCRICLALRQAKRGGNRVRWHRHSHWLYSVHDHEIISLKMGYK